VPVQRCYVDQGQARMGLWPYTLPAVSQLVEHGLPLDPGVTVLIGENGSGKSTIVEALAATWGRRITAFRDDVAMQIVTRPSEEDSDLHRSLRLEYTRGGGTGGFFLRAEQLHSQAPSLGKRGRWQARLGDRPLLERSHGEGFLQVLNGMTEEVGLYILDEPESALSFTSSLALLLLLQEMRSVGSQVVMATHSPVLAAVPGARILELGEWGIRQVDYDDTDLVTGWRAFLNAPER
jgi:predicted ATPase